MKPTMEWLLFSIFIGFRWLWEAKLGGKSFQKRIRNMIKSSYDFNTQNEAVPGAWAPHAPDRAQPAAAPCNTRNLSLEAGWLEASKARGINS